MKAAIRSEYGGPEVINIGETDKPVPRDNEVLIKVHAATVNRTDCGILWGKPFIIRFFTGLSRPRKPITGTDFSGEVEAVGKDVTTFKVGDKVWGFDDNGLESHAEYLVLPGDGKLITMPDYLSYEEAAASPEGAHYAYNFVNKVHPGPEHRVMLNGATGAIGSATLQILKYYGSFVTAVCNTENMVLIKSLGADKVIDYTKEDFTNDDDKYDFVFDAVGKSSFGRCKPLLKPGGVYISSELGPQNENIYLPFTTAIKGGKRVKFPYPKDIPATLRFIKELIDQGKFKPVIDRTYKLENIREAFEYVNSGRKTGNVVIRLAETKHK
jgi:NADPH:quinone reductase-like Zn-dependent oxidoreductase